MAKFKYDVFLSHSPKDRAVVRRIAERLEADGLRVWTQGREVEKALQGARVLVLCMSANAFGKDLPRLESQTLRFRDRANEERRFIPLRLDDAPIPGSLSRLAHIRWSGDEGAYAKLIEQCRPVTSRSSAHDEPTDSFSLDVAAITLKLSPTGNYAAAYVGNAIYLWNLRTHQHVRVLKTNSGIVDIGWTLDESRLFSASLDQTARLWDVETASIVRVFAGHAASVWSVAASRDGHRLLSGSKDQTVRMWDAATGKCLRIFEGHQAGVSSMAWSSDQRHVLSSSDDKTLRLWDVETATCVRVFEGHDHYVSQGLLSVDQRYALSGSEDHTVRFWDAETGRCLRVMEGHAAGVFALAWSPDERYALSGSDDKTVRLWDLRVGLCITVLEGHPANLRSVIWQNHSRAMTADGKGNIRVWDLSKYISPAGAVDTRASRPLAQVQYTNAKVLLVGESSSGKTGLSKRLALNTWEPSDSTVGAWATQWKLPVDSSDDVEREIWLWDFGGQADQRLIHQLYMDETALAVLVFDGQKEDIFETLGQWDLDLTRATQRAFSKLLVAGRVDTGRLRASSREQVEAFAKERGFSAFLETSAKTGESCDQLRQAILDGIRWEDIPWRSSPLLFKRLKDEIVRLKDEGRVLMRFNDLRETLDLKLSGEDTRFSAGELKAVISLLAGPGVVWELKFGSWVLLQPERINAYAQAVIQTMREDKDDRGCLAEERVLSGNLAYHASMGRLDPDDERFVLLAMHQTLVERGLCFREHTDKGAVLIFPSYYRRERPELVEYPAVLVSYRFNGFLDDIYATLVVRLHHTESFTQDALWRYAADFKTPTEKQVGVKLTRKSNGEGELEVYFDAAVPIDTKIIFSKYVHEHLLQNARDVVRLRHHVCLQCGTVVGNREVAMKRLEAWLQQHPAGTKRPTGTSETPTIICAECEKRVPLWDELEESFASPEIQRRVRELQEQAAIVLDNESKERALVGEVISTVALAGQLSRELTVSDHGIDMEIEFKWDSEATGSKLYLQLKSGDSYLRQRQSDGVEIFSIKNERHARYWREQKFPVLLVIRTSDGEVRWMEIREYLKRVNAETGEDAKQIVFVGERFDVISVRRWRDRVLGSA